MLNFNNIEIDKNSICYGNEVLKISNISRMWIFRFQNKEKRAHELAKERYEELKRCYESQEQYKKKIEIIKYSIVCLLTGIFSVYLLDTTLWGLLALAISVIYALKASRGYKKRRCT